MRNEDVRERDNIFMAQMLEELEFAVRALRQDGGTEGLHDFLHSHFLARQLICCTAYKAESTHSHGLELGVPSGDLEIRAKYLDSNEVVHRGMAGRTNGRAGAA